jgi:serine/threonine-protein kinase HipA
MRRAEIYQEGILAGYLTEVDGRNYRFEYLPEYRGRPISLTMPVQPNPYEFSQFPPTFEGLLPEGVQLGALLRREKLDANDLMGQLLAVGEDVVGSLVIRAVDESPPDLSRTDLDE